MTVKQAFNDVLRGISQGDTFSAEDLKEAAQTAIEYYEYLCVQEENYRSLGKMLELSARKISHLSRAVEHLSAALSEENADTTYCG